MDEAQPSAVDPRAHVDDTELLYHAVRRAHFTRHSETDVTVSANAYSDPETKPSVDRAHMRDFEPQRTRFNESDGIVSLITKNVRDINDVFQYTASGQPTGDPYVYDVIWRPVKDDPSPNVRDNLAHAQIEADRAMNDGTFKRLRRALALMSSKRAELDPYEQVVYLTRTRKVYHRRTCHHVKKCRTPVAFKKLPIAATPCSHCRPQGWATEDRI
jgi:hypothetical protein